MMLKLTESYKTAVISTAHVTAADSERLPIACFDPLTDRGLNWLHGTQYGWIVRAGMRGNDWKEELRDYGISQEAIPTYRPYWMPGMIRYNLTVMRS
ncbi:hypothetical protein SJ265_20080 [Citrobacter portucalensis]|uniref:DUF5983 domain-containing protein n=1 Tax=Citrobacter portucalensis TaxID=1639133 RepID=A0AAW9ENQ8_9ENTR|nr:hypothetical protein [Citrobacter portucalensis]MDX7150081.1 hypothetical protein [Citrobacter portucalensis]